MMKVSLFHDIQVELDILIFILDVNDNAPTFLNLPNETYVYENATFSTLLFKVDTYDPDLANGGLVSYNLSAVTPSDSGMVSPYITTCCPPPPKKKKKKKKIRSDILAPISFKINLNMI